MNDKEILASAPKDGKATHVEILPQNLQYYRREFKTWCNKFVYDLWDNDAWLNAIIPTGNMRSLADIQRIIDLEEDRDKYLVLADEYRKTGNRVINYGEDAAQWCHLTYHKDTKKCLQAHNLEQQAKGCFGAICAVSNENIDGSEYILMRHINNYGSKKMIEAKELDHE